MYIKEAQRHLKQARSLTVILDQIKADILSDVDDDICFALVCERDCLAREIAQHVHYARQCLYTSTLVVCDIDDLPF